MTTDNLIQFLKAIAPIIIAAGGSSLLTNLINSRKSGRKTDAETDRIKQETAVSRESMLEELEKNVLARVEKNYIEMQKELDEERDARRSDREAYEIAIANEREARERDVSRLEATIEQLSTALREKDERMALELRKKDEEIARLKKENDNL